jgi:hypothetical protein
MSKETGMVFARMEDETPIGPLMNYEITHKEFEKRLKKKKGKVFSVFK